MTSEDASRLVKRADRAAQKANRALLLARKGKGERFSHSFLIRLPILFAGGLK